MHDERGPKQGSALIAVLIVSAAIVFAGAAFLMVTGTDGHIARNEATARQASYAAEAGARAVKGWFEQPGVAPGFPWDDRIVVRDREILDEVDPYGAPPATGGVQYKQGIDADGDGRDDLFRRPYRGDVRDTLLGTDDAPDLLIEDPDWLAALSATRFGDSDLPGNGLRASILEIRVFAPPYLRVGTSWVRHGVATVRVVGGVARIERNGSETVVARRTARLVLGEVPWVPSSLEAVHACGDAVLSGESGIRWGGLSARGDVALPAGPGVVPSLPRGLPGPDGSDRLWTSDPAWLAEFARKLDPAERLADPWFRIVAGGAISGAPSAGAQPWGSGPPPPPGTPAFWECCDRTNLIQQQASVPCPAYPYATWKRIARSGLRGAHYYAWRPGEGYLEDGHGPGGSLEQILASAAGRPGLRFFDTADGRPPRDDDADGHPDNLGPPVVLRGGWSARGLVYLNAERVTLDGLVDSMPTRFRAPAEPAVGGPDAWIDLVYPTVLDAPFRPGPSGDRDAAGPEIATLASFHGLLISSGAVEVRRGGTLYGSIVAGTVLLDGSIPPATRIHRDSELARSGPPEGWGLPRLAIGRVAID
jgi:hypothetical protein